MRTVLSLCAIALMGLLIVGCGNGSATNQAGQTGIAGATLTINWPTRGRLIPQAANSIAVELFAGTQYHERKVVARPTEGNTSTIAFTNFPAGYASFTAAAYASSDGTGTALAVGYNAQTIFPNQQATINLTMYSTITQVVVTPDPVNVSVSGTVQMHASFKDYEGNVVLVAPSKVHWTSGDATVATIDAASGLLTGVANGTTIVTVTDEESDVTSAEISVTVGTGTQQPTGSFIGDWNSNAGIFSIRNDQTTGQIRGNYEYDAGRIVGTLSQDGRTLTGTWSEAPSYTGDYDCGTFVFTLNTNGTAFDGYWGYGSDTPTNYWPGTKLTDVVKIFDNGNIAAVVNNPTAATVFTTTSPYVITEMYTYHWNDGAAPAPGTITLQEADGTTYGPFSAYPVSGMYNNLNANWTVNPMITLPAGTYTVIDSDPATWSQNTESSGQGMFLIWGHPAP